MKTINYIFLALATLAAITLGACSDNKSYADLLQEENMYVNNFLADQRVELSIPADTVFETGPDAPYYRLDEDGMLYMQVLRPGTPGNRVENDEQIYFRYTRYALAMYSDGKLGIGEGNNITLAAAWFRYNNYQLQSSYNWGVGIQAPLRYLPVDCEVNIVIKSQMGVTSETNEVYPYLWRLTYDRRR
ncbi:MAG: DUF4827 domain-containing protein [Muribaculaceae bacterium]|nr:DUF4827 domain-containing protein [Muribaculaceae bacterium]